MNRHLNPGLVALVAAAVLAAPGRGVMAQTSNGSGCQSNDTACRLDGLERRLDYLIDMMESRQQDRPGRPSLGRSVDIPVNQSCGNAVDGCSVLASQLCARGGFARGVPAQTTPGPFGTTLNRATCLE